mgnify:CR=1 FL=1
MVKVEFLFWEGCSSRDRALERLKKVLDELNVKYEIEIIEVKTEEDAQRLKFPGSPTIRINGEDIQPETAKPPYSLSCRTYIINGRFLPLPGEEYLRERIKEIINDIG